MNALQRDLKKLVPLVESLGKETVAADPHRQRFHLQPPVGWLNDPNGLCVYGGQYHAFFQYGPFDVNGGVKHWGHAVSTDLLHWEQLPVMLYPDEPFDCHGAYSGSALVEDGTMYLYYTGNVKHPGNFDYIKEGRGHNVCLAVSKDGVTLDSKQCLLTNRDYPAGLTCHVRDPKVFAYEGRYYMVLGARTLEDKGEVLVLESTDKLRWTHINTLTTPEPFGYMWECPDLFCLDGQWYLAVSPQGIDCQNVYGCGWQHCFTVPRVLTAGPDGTLLQNPVPELDAQRSAAALHAASGEEVFLAPRFDLTAAPAGDFCLTVAQGVQLVYTEQDCTCTLRFTDPALADGRTVRRARLAAPCCSLRVVGDNSSLEIFLNGGATVFSTRYYPAPGDVSVKLTGAACELCNL